MVTGCYYENVLAIRTEGDRTFLDHGVCSRFVQQHPQMGEHSRQQLIARVGQRCAHQHVSRAVIDERVDGTHLGEAEDAGACRDFNLNRLPLPDQLNGLLGHIKVNVKLACVLQTGDNLGTLQVIARIDLANANGAGEGRDDALFFQRRSTLCHHGGVAIEFSAEPVELAFGDGADFHQFAAALKVLKGQALVGLCHVQFGLLGLVLKLQQGLPGLDPLP